MDLLVMRISGLAPFCRGVEIFSNCSHVGIGGTGVAVFELKTLRSPIVAEIREQRQSLDREGLEHKTAYSQSKDMGAVWK